MSEFDNEAAQWLAEARAGSPEALGKALENCRKYLLLIAGRQLDGDLHRKGGASDLVQETFLEAHRDFGRFHGESEDELLAWLRQILLNNIANFTRRYRTTGKREVGREVALEPHDSAHVTGSIVPDPARTPTSEAVEREQAEALNQALERLPGEYRLAIVYRYIEGRSFDEIGALTGRSADAARKLWARAMQRLREEWESSHGSEFK
jgi:RNA polymerase sigma-70 factor (ECF subfamily)